MSVTIAVANQKGGVAKTTTAIHLGAWFAARGRRTLIVDTDSQGHVATALGAAKGPGLERMLVEEWAPARAATRVRPNLDIITNDHTSELVKEHVSRANFREFLLAAALENADYELIVLDTPPSTDVLHVATLVASDYVIIPAKMDFLALDGINGVLQMVRQLGRFPNVEAPALIGILPTMFDRSTNETTENVKRLQQALGAHQLLPPIPADTKIREASSYGMTIFEFAPKSPAAIGYSNGSKVVNSQGRTGGYLHLAEIVEGIVWR